MISREIRRLINIYREMCLFSNSENSMYLSNGICHIACSLRYFEFVTHCCRINRVKHFEIAHTTRIPLKTIFSHGLLTRTRGNANEMQENAQISRENFRYRCSQRRVGDLNVDKIARRKPESSNLASVQGLGYYQT